MSDLLPLESALSAQLNENGMAPALELRAKLLRAQARRAADCQIHQSPGETAHAGEADTVVKPQPVAVEARDRPEGIPASIVSETAVIANFGKKAPNRWDRVAQLVGQRLYHPARLLEKKGRDALSRL